VSGLRALRVGYLHNFINPRLHLHEALHLPYRNTTLYHVFGVLWVWEGDQVTVKELGCNYLLYLGGGDVGTYADRVGLPR
jgi:hypothetical protein